MRKTAELIGHLITAAIVTIIASGVLTALGIVIGYVAAVAAQAYRFFTLF